VGLIPDALELTFVSDSFSTGQALSFRLEGRDVDNLQLATAEVREALARYPGVFDISDSFRAGKQEVQIQLLEEGRLLGLHWTTSPGRFDRRFSARKPSAFNAAPMS